MRAKPSNPPRPRKEVLAARRKRFEKAGMCNACGKHPPRRGVGHHGQLHKRCLTCESKAEIRKAMLAVIRAVEN
jgi:hypothetical protein